MHLRLVGRVELKEPLDAGLVGAPGRVRRIVAELGVLDQVPEHVDAEAVDAPVQPEAQHLVHGGADLGITPVEVGLLLQEGVVVELARGLVPFPGRAAEIAEPVVGRRAVGLAVPPDVPVPLRAGARGAALQEPGVLVGGVVRHEVQYQLQSAPVRLCEQGVEILEGAEQRIDRPVVGDVVAEVGHGRDEDRRDPDRLHAEVHEMIQAPADSVQVADPVAVGVLERPRIDLVDDAGLPPISARHSVTSPAATSSPEGGAMTCGFARDASEQRSWTIGKASAPIAGPG